MATMPMHRTGHTAATIAGGLIVVLGIALGLISEAGREPVDPLLGSVALAGLVAAPGMLALLGLHDRTALWLPAGLAAPLLALLSSLTLPLLPTGIVFLIAWIRYPLPHTRSRVHPGIVTVLVVSLLLTAAAMLFISDDPASWTTPTGGGATSDIITNREALLSLASTTLALITGWTLARPRPRQHPA